MSVRVKMAGIESRDGNLTEYWAESRAKRNGWRDRSRARAVESTGAGADIRVCSWLEDSDDIAVYDPGFIRYLDVRVRGGDSFLIRIHLDEERGIFSSYDQMNQKHLRVGYSQVKALLERPKESVILGRKLRKQK